MLCKHLDALGFGDGGIEIETEGLDKVDEAGAELAGLCGDQTCDTLDVSLGDAADALSPVLPIGTFAALLYKLGIDTLLELLFEGEELLDS